MEISALTTVVDFWFSEDVKKKWWIKDLDFDQQIIDTFSDLHRDISKMKDVKAFLSSPLNALAAVIVLDQFSRNMFRGDARSFTFDHQALTLAQKAIAKSLDKDLIDEQMAFLYMPFMHSEELKDHAMATELFSSREGLSNNLKAEYAHKDIIERFGRYPHRNKTLGRKSTDEEIKFLKQPNSSF